jgi:hypothetical protein
VTDERSDDRSYGRADAAALKCLRSEASRRARPRVHDRAHEVPMREGGGRGGREIRREYRHRIAASAHRKCDELVERESFKHDAARESRSMRIAALMSPSVRTCSARRSSQ